MMSAGTFVGVSLPRFDLDSRLLCGSVHQSRKDECMHSWKITRKWKENYLQALEIPGMANRLLNRELRKVIPNRPAENRSIVSLDIDIDGDDFPFVLCLKQ